MNLYLTDIQSVPILVSANQNAVINKNYTVVANAVFTDPTPVEGKGFIVYVRNGTATIGGTPYGVGSYVLRVYHSGAWSNKNLDFSSDLLLKQDKFYLYKEVEPSEPVTLTTSEVEVHNRLVEGGTLSSSDILRIMDLRIIKTVILNGFTAKIKISTDGILPSGTTGQIATYIGAANVVFASMQRTFFIENGFLTGYNFTNPSLTDVATTSNAQSSIALNVANDFHIHVSLQLFNANDSALLQGINFKNI